MQLLEGAFGLNDRLKVDAMYESYIADQQHEFDEIRREAEMELPSDLDYGHLSMQLSNEEREKLALTRPASIGCASRIPGMTPSAVVSLLRFVKKQQPPPSNPTPGTTSSSVKRQQQAVSS